jgi:hypothetical protein
MLEFQLPLNVFHPSADSSYRRPQHRLYSLARGGNMSISSITSPLSYSNPAIQESVQSSSQRQPVKLPAAEAQDTEDTVHLSQPVQIQQMAQQGESVSSIANATGLTLSEVDSDLGISTTSSNVPVAVPRGHGGGHPADAAPVAAAAASHAAAPAATSQSKTATPTATLSVRA